ncbi:MAG: DUF3089 domain-containing protein [Kordiimonas sp.]
MAKQKMKPAAIFLLLVTVVIVIVIVGGIWLGSDTNRALRLAFTPSHTFEEDTRDTVRDYSEDTSWAALPNDNSAAMARPAGIMDIAVVPEVDVFFVHPTTYLKKAHWNAPHDAPIANASVDLRAIKAQASAFNTAGRIYAPRYRQATVGAFFDETGEGVKALGLAYTDVLASFDDFITNRNKGRPFILAGHSQGSLHLLYLLQHRISGTGLKDRMIAAYLIGWPVSIEADLGALSDIDACKNKQDTGCVVSWQTFGLGGNPENLKTYMETTMGLGGTPRKDTQMLCTNPLDWLIGSNDTRSAHLGAIVRADDATAPLGKPIAKFTGTQCGTDGVLYITDLPDDAWQQYKMAGENYHPYDIPMFYMNLRENAVLRAQSWVTKQN